MSELKTFKLTKNLLDMAGEAVTVREVLKAFEKVLDVVKRREETLEKRIGELSTRLEQNSNLTASELKQQFDRAMSIISRMEKGKAGSDGYTPVKGKDYFTAAELAQLRLDIRPADGYTPVKGKDYFDGKDGSPDTAVEIADKLETLEGSDRLSMEAIRDLPEKIKELESRPAGKGGARKITYVKRENLSSQCNGLTKTFTLPKDTIEVLGIWGTQFPINFNPGTDWTFSGRTLTLTDEVSAPETGQTLYALIETLFYG